MAVNLPTKNRAIDYTLLTIVTVGLGSFVVDSESGTRDIIDTRFTEFQRQIADLNRHYDIVSGELDSHQKIEAHTGQRVQTEHLQRQISQLQLENREQQQQITELKTMIAQIP